MKKEIETKKDALLKIKKHLKSLAIKSAPYTPHSANKKIQPTQKTRG